MLTKKMLQSQIVDFPESFSIDELVERLILVEKIEKGIEQSKNNSIIPDENIDTEIEKWFR